MLYIRHGEKLYANGKSTIYPLDPGLTESGKEKVKCRIKVLVGKFGVPPNIVTSPYLRARETAQIAHDVILEITQTDVPIHYDSSIGEFLGHQSSIPLEIGVHPDTLKHNPLPSESRYQFTSRVKKHLDSNRLPGLYITHGLVIKTIADTYGKSFPYPQELEGIRITNKHIYSV